MTAGGPPAPNQATAEVGNLLLRLRPDLSAAVPIWPAQKFLLAALLTAAAATAFLLPDTAFAIGSLFASVVFFVVAALRMMALQDVLRPGGNALTRRPPLSRRADAELPTYAVLVALYDEAAIVPALVAAMARLDYPTGKLAIRLVVEERDGATRRAIAALELPPHFAVIVVPEGEPRTKPRALNFALSLTPGEYIVIYDAEDMPERDQLRRALDGFAGAPPATGCLQARLNTMNHAESWITRQFSIEYTSLFDCMLPTLERRRIPIPLGGTSNHFRRVDLETVLAWDPCNVTEDADLGVRLARFGIGVGVFPSTTWEEAPPSFGVWLGQRTRWLKGWMITWLVHMRSPRRLCRDLGWRKFIGLQLYMISAVISPLVHPWFIGALVAAVATGRFPSVPPRDALEATAWWVSVATLAGSYASAMALGAVAVARRRRMWLIPHIVWLPIYWLAVSLAAYSAIIELLKAPYRWRKTPHRARPLRHRER